MSTRCWPIRMRSPSAVREYEPKYCDVIVRRWQAYTGKAAIFEGIGLTFEDLEGARDRGG